MLLSEAIANIILDPIFIFVFKMGMMGAAVATVAGQIISALLSFIFTIKMKTMSLDRSSFVIKWNKTKRKRLRQKLLTKHPTEDLQFYNR